ncbi:MAG: radical SAM protein [Candidatus Bathyarchaeota archaeon]|nr:radical SAM protein [Candidatus Bathyarchaeota archaeon]MDH5786997.1 radical SAM protein [Candidatus Bathyarchaeota archaeon]
MGKCQICGEKAVTISENLGVCVKCIRGKPERAFEITGNVHAKSRAVFGLASEPPKDAGGLPCGVCANDCVISAGNSGFCGLVRNVGGRLVRFGGSTERGILEWYYDGLPTNCVSWWFCPGCTGRGYPKYAYKPEAEHGYSNLAVFYGAYSYDCLFCQNWHYRKLSAKQKPVVSAEALAAKTDDKHVSCVCFFGGDPSPQMPHSLEVSRIVTEKARAEKRIFRICWETNGNMNAKLGEKAAEYALESGGNIKFDLKAFSEKLNVALCGVSNNSTLANFKTIGERLHKQRVELPLLSASTLLVPGYIDAEEVEDIAKFISEIDPNIPYTLLAFYPRYVMNDLPTTSRKQASECQKVAEKHLKNTRIGNIHLLS